MGPPSVRILKDIHVPNILVTALKRSCGKVMFLHLSVILFTGGSLSRGGRGLCPEGGRCLCPEGGGGLYPGEGVSVRAVYPGEGVSVQGIR